MQNVDADHTRNFAIIGHSGDGKTSLGEAILHRAGATKELGSVDEGTSVLNHLPEERTGHHTASVTSHVFGFDWRDSHFTLVDTPGDPNFSGDGEVALQALDAAVLVVDAVEGAKSGTNRMLTSAEGMNVPVIGFINGLDRERADIDRVMKSLTELEKQPVLLSLPIGTNSELSGVVDLLHMKAVGTNGKATDIPADMQEESEAAREQLVEAAAECNDELLERYLEEGELSNDEVQNALAAGIANRQVLPLVCGSATREIGVDTILQDVTELLPSAAARGAWEAHDIGKQSEVSAEPDESAPFSAIVFKTIIDRYAGTLSVMRVVSGKLTPDMGILNATQDKKTRAGKLLLPQGQEHSDASHAGPGDVVAIAKAKDVHTGDVLTSEKGGLRLPEPRKPEGVISYAVEALNRDEDDKLFSSLAKLVQEDPALHIGREPSTGEFLLTCMGELHVRTTANKLNRMFNVQMNLKTPKVPYRETVTKRVENVEGKLKKQSGGAGMFAVCYINLEPRERSSGVVFDDKIVGGSIPRNLIPAVEKGVMEACVAGPLAGYPVVDVNVECVDGKFHSVDSNEMAFKLAGSFALRAAVEQAGAVLLEPYMSVEIVVPDDYVGDVMGDVSSRRGTVQTTEARGHSATVIATVPMSEMLEYATTLTSMTGGKGEFHMSFSHYDQLSGKLAEKVIAGAKQESGKD